MSIDGVKKMEISLKLIIFTRDLCILKDKKKIKITGMWEKKI